MDCHSAGENDRHFIINFTGFIINKKFFFGISCSSLINLPNKQKKTAYNNFFDQGRHFTKFILWHICVTKYKKIQECKL